MFSACRDSPTRDEIAHLPAGLSHWRFGRFELYATNPPLVRSIAAVPLAVGGVDMPWERIRFLPRARGEWNFGADFMKADPQRAMLWFTLARWSCLPFTVLGGYICLRWARDLYGRAAGTVALALWCFSPSVLAYGHLITPDAATAAMGVAAAYSFWRWLKTPTWQWTLGAGLLLGLAELTKTTWVVLFPLWVVIWVAWRCADRKKPSPAAPLPEGEGRLVQAGASGTLTLRDPSLAMPSPPAPLPKGEGRPEGAAPRSSRSRFDLRDRALFNKSRLRLRGLVRTVGRVSFRERDSQGAERRICGPFARIRQPLHGLVARFGSRAAADELSAWHRYDETRIRREDVVLSSRRVAVWAMVVLLSLRSGDQRATRDLAAGGARRWGDRGGRVEEEALTPGPSPKGRGETVTACASRAGGRRVVLFRRVAG